MLAEEATGLDFSPFFTRKSSIFFCFEAFLGLFFSCFSFFSGDFASFGFFFTFTGDDSLLFSFSTTTFFFFLGLGNPVLFVFLLFLDLNIIFVKKCFQSLELFILTLKMLRKSSPQTLNHLHHQSLTVLWLGI